MRVVGTLAAGARIHPLSTFRDGRGALTEIFRFEWQTDVAPVQWNCVVSEPGIMRGVHIHLGYWEYYVVLHGRSTIGFRDVRRGSPTEGAAGLIEVSGRRLCAVITPPGVAHGIYFDEPSTLLVGTGAYWNTTKELGCDWRDSALRIPWPVTSALVSERDASLPTFADLASQLPRWVGDGNDASPADATLR